MKERLAMTTTSKRLRAALVLALLALQGCVHPVDFLKREFRSAGEHFAGFPEEVWAEHACDEKPLPYFKLEQNELLPRKLRAGDEFNHRFAYALCPTEPSAIVSGALDTVILHRGKAIMRDDQARFELKPGRWVVDSFVVIPEAAEPGIYSLRLQFRGKPVRFQEDISFVVEPSGS